MSLPPSLSLKTQGQLLDLAWSLAPLSRSDELARASSEAIESIIGADEVHYNEIELGTGRVAVRVYPDEKRSSEESALFASVVTEHPVSTHFARRPEAVPVRLTDLLSMRELRRTKAYGILLRPRGFQFQLILPLRVDGGKDGHAVTGGRAFAINRTSRNFSKEAVDAAFGIQLTLGAVHAALAARVPTDEQIDAAREKAGITERELEILNLVNVGMTATAIGRAKRISAATVRKHMQNIYLKLELHDRLAVVTYCRAAGLLSSEP